MGRCAVSLHVASLFSGVGLIDAGLERAGVTTRLLCESDKACRSVLARHYPGVPIHPDVTELTPDGLRAAGLDPARTVLAAGFPCQDLSVAGRRAGMGKGTRSGLYWHIVRILGEFPARWVILENVPGLLSSNDGRDFGAVVGSLVDLGYGVSWRVLDAAYSGVPQRRRRVVIVGHLGAPWSAPVEVLFDPESSAGDSRPSREAGSDVAATLTAGVSGAGVSAPGRRREDDVNLVVSALTSNGVGTCGADDNQAQARHLVVSTFQKVRRSGARDAAGELPPEVWEPRDVAATLSPFDLGSDARAVDLVVSATGRIAHALTSEGHDASEDGTGRGTPIVAFHPTQSPITGVVSPALGAGTRGMGVHDATGVRRLTPVECERLQGAPDGWTAGQSDAARYRQLGNSVAVPVFEWVGQRIVTVDDALRAAVSA